MTTAQFLSKTTYCAMIADREARSVRFVNALGFTCAAAECSKAQFTGLQAKVIKKSERARWADAASRAGFSVVL